MNKLKNLVVKNSEVDTEFGFFFVELQNGKSLQCCLKQYQDHEGGEPYFLKQIEIDNSGYSDGLCADCNNWAVIDNEWSHIEEFLIDHARLAGVEIVA